MSKPFRIITAFICLAALLLSAPVYAAEDRIVTSDVSVKTDRLFEVKIGFNSDRVITAARFTLTYNPEDVAVRTPVCDIDRAVVKFNDKNGTTDIIFLCSDGIKCREYPTLFSMKYKKISDNNTKITIKASDCVDNNLKNFTPPAPAVCGVNSDGKPSSDGGSEKAADSQLSDDSESSPESKDADNAEASSAVLSDAQSDEIDTIAYKGDENPLYLTLFPIILVVFVLIFLGIILYQNTKLRKAEKHRKDESEQEKDSKE